MNETLLTVFVGATCVAVILQMGILLALYITSRKTAQRMEALAKRVEEQALPTIEMARNLLTENTPKINSIITDLTSTTATVKAQAERISTAVTDVVDRTRLQTIRADEMVTRTLDRIEETAETMQTVVLSPMRRMSGVLTGVMAGLGEFVGGRRVRRQTKAVPNEDMFI
jgi:methyl-accepting chemotaxis protein